MFESATVVESHVLHKQRFLTVVGVRQMGIRYKYQNVQKVDRHGRGINTWADNMHNRRIPFQIFDGSLVTSNAELYRNYLGHVSHFLAKVCPDLLFMENAVC